MEVIALSHCSRALTGTSPEALSVRDEPSARIIPCTLHEPPAQKIASPQQPFSPTIVIAQPVRVIAARHPTTSLDPRDGDVQVPEPEPPAMLTGIQPGGHVVHLASHLSAAQPAPALSGRLTRIQSVTLADDARGRISSPYVLPNLISPQPAPVKRSNTTSTAANPAGRSRSAISPGLPLLAPLEADIDTDAASMLLALAGTADPTTSLVPMPFVPIDPNQATAAPTSTSVAAATIAAAAAASADPATFWAAAEAADAAKKAAQAKVAPSAVAAAVAALMGTAYTASLPPTPLDISMTSMNVSAPPPAELPAVATPTPEVPIVEYKGKKKRMSRDVRLEMRKAGIADDCGECRECLDMIKFGGKGHRKSKHTELLPIELLPIELLPSPRLPSPSYPRNVV